jgi:peptide/nickel transport system substrate-binding protein
VTQATRRGILALGATLATPSIVRASGDAVTIAWPSDVPGWDPNQRFAPEAQSLYKAVFDQPLDQDPSLRLIPHLLTRWQLSSDALTMPIELRGDVVFHNGDKLTAEDFRFTFFDRRKTTPGLDIANSWRKVQDIEVLSPTRAVMHFNSPAPTAPAWLAFLGSYVVPKVYVERVGVPAFAQKPIGTGPYRLVEWVSNGRIVLERNDRYWGPKPAVRRVTVQIVKDPSSRAAAVQSGQADLAINLPAHEALRLRGEPGLAAALDPITRIILLQVRNDLGFANADVRLAAHHAIDKAALSRAFYNDAAVPLSQLATPGTPGYMDGLNFKYDPNLARQLLAKSGFNQDRPVRIGFATTSGQFPSDYEIARAIAQMWKPVGIEADIRVIEYGSYFELNRAHRLPEATLYSFDNATGDPEIFVGYMLNPQLPFSPWQDMAIGRKAIDLFNVADTRTRIDGWKALDREAMAIGAKIPLLQSVLTIARQKNLSVVRYGNGWVLPQTMRWT